jgi:hypothetical protein
MFFGPYAVEQRIWVQLPKGSHIHPMFHVLQPKPILPSYTPVFTELDCPPDLSATTLAPVEMLDHRMVTQDDDTIVQLNIKWDKLLADSAT